ARLPGSNDPSRSSIPRTHAGFAVVGVGAVSGAIRYSAAAVAMTSGIDRHGDVPGLKSVARVTAAPAARSDPTGGRSAPMNSVEVGRRTAAVSASPSAATPASL